MSAKIICGFPGIGKTSLASENKRILDMDAPSYYFDGIFPYGYIKRVKENLFNADLILISAHRIVLEVLNRKKMDYILVYPKTELKDEYMQRYRRRRSPMYFYKYMDKMWDKFMWDMQQQIDRKHIILESGEYLKNVLDKIDF